MVRSKRITSFFLHLFGVAVACFIHITATAQTNLGKIDHIDAHLLNTFIIKEVNKIRKKAKVDPVQNNTELEAPAKDHAEYLRRKRKLTHFQRKRIKRTPKNRTDFYGAKFESVGENVQLNNLNLDARVGDKKNPKISTYEQLAETLVLGWKNSPPHYKNMVNPNHKMTFTSFSITENGEVYACQLFGSSMYVDKYQEQRDSVSYKPDNPRKCWRCKIRPPIGIVSVREDSTIVFEYTARRFLRIFPKPMRKYSRMRLFNPWRDGLAADVIVKSQYTCDSSSYFNGVSNVRGISLPPVYKKDFKGLGLYRTEIVLGKVPDYIHEEFEVNLIVVQNKRPCSNTMFNILPSDFHVDIPLSYDFEPSNQLLRSYATHTLSRKFTFDKSQIKPSDSSYLKFLSELNEIPGNVEKIEIFGFASIEGASEANMRLYQERANFLKAELAKTGIDTSLVDLESSENFDEFRKDVVGTKYEYLAAMSVDELKLQLLDRRLSDSLEFILRKHRYVEVKVHTKQVNEQDYDILMANQQLKWAIEVGNLSEAVVAQQIQYKLVLENKADKDHLKLVDIPREKKYTKLLHNRAIMQYKLEEDSIEALHQLKSNLSGMLELSKNDKRIHTSLAIVDYHLYRSGFNDTRKNHIYDTIRKRKYIDREQRSRILLNLASNHDWNLWYGLKTYNKGNYLNKKVQKYVKSAKLDVEHTFEIASYYSFFNENKYAYSLTKSKVDDTENPNDLIYFLKLIHLTDVDLARNKYLGYFKKIKKYGGEDFCTFFNNPALNFQIFDDEEIKRIYCEECSNSTVPNSP